MTTIFIQNSAAHSAQIKPVKSELPVDNSKTITNPVIHVSANSTERKITSSSEKNRGSNTKDNEKESLRFDDRKQGSRLNTVA
jgi:hypothetical protein